MEMWKEIDKSNNYENTRGYKYCNISINSHISKVKIHILVAKAFINNLENKETVNHINGNKLDNNILNLEWLTRKENLQRAHKLGLYNKNKAI